MNTHVAPEPDVSAVIATRGRGELLRRALRSIIAQEYDGQLQVIVVYDQCDVDELDDIRELLPEGVELITATNTRTAGLAGGRNSGIALATGELVAFCDDDDEWVPRRLRAQVQLWRSHPGAAVVSSGMTVVTQEGEVHRMPQLFTTREDLVRSRVGDVHPSSFLFRRADLVALPGGVDEELPYGYGEDYDLLLRITERGPILSVQDHLVLVHWDRDSYFAGRWATMAGGLSYMLDKHPELLQDKRNAAHMSGQVAFAHAAAGNRTDAKQWLGRTLRHRPVEPRALLTMLVLSKVMSPRTILATLNKRGLGI